MYLNYFFTRKNKITLYILLFILLWNFIILFSSKYIISEIPSDKDEIIQKGNDTRKEIALRQFDLTKKNLFDISYKLLDNLNIRKALEKGDARKVYELTADLDINEQTSIEIFDKRTESVFFLNKQIPSEINLIQKALSGITTLQIKDNGFFTYLISYQPIRNSNEERIIDVLLTAILIDTKYDEEQFELNSKILSVTLKDNFDSDVAIEPPRNPFEKSPLDSEYVKLPLPDNERNVIGNLYFTPYDLTVHIDKVRTYSSNIIAVLTFFITLLMIPLLWKLILLFKPPFIKIVICFISLVLIRYLWILSGFPSVLFINEIFNPSYYASKYGGGIFKSLGELMITVHFIMIFSLFIVYASFSKFSSFYNTEKTWKEYIKIVLLIGVYFLLFYLFGSALTSLIYNSNIVFLEKINIIPELPLFIVQLSILFISFSFLVLHSVTIIYILNTVRNLGNSKLLKRFYILLVFAIFILLNEFFNAFDIDLRIYNIYRLMIITLIFIFAYYILKSYTSKRSNNIFSIRNFSILLLLCIIITPVIILDITKSQETSIIENIGSELIEDQNEKIIFMLSDELSKFRDNKVIENYIYDVNKQQQLAYYLWSSSKFSFEKYNSDLIVLDTNKKVLSDFNSGTYLINSDTITAYLKRNFFNKKMTLDAFDNDDTTEIYEDSESIPEDKKNELTEILNFNDITILENNIGKYYIGVLPVEITELKNTQFSKKLGYIVIALNSETFNLFSENKFSVYFDIQGGRHLDRLITKPIITEFYNGEIVNSSDIEVSKSVSKFLIPFRESIKNSNKKYTWRYDPLNNERYRTFYISKEDDTGNNNDIANERIYALSVKRDDLGLLTFYFLKFVLFAISVFVGFYALYAIIYISKARKIRLNFKEKLFVSFILVSVIPIVILAIYTRSYINTKNDSNYKNQLLSDLSLLNETLKDEKILFNKYKPDDTLKNAAGNILMRNFANTNKNYNIFIKGKIFASTNDELFKSDFIDQRISDDGYYNIYILKKDLYIHTKNIQGQSYLVGYRPLKDRNGNVNGIISSFSVYKQKEIQEELTETLTFIFGLYFIVIIILLIVVSIIANKISQPILSLKEATDRLAKGEENFNLDIERSDELGNLVDSFNKMTRDLKKSKENLKKAEREAAWRDIARRVAHEIKNPLTPIKLSIQHLYNMYYEEDKENFDKVLKKTKELITNEIDKLNHIATAFSDFAKLPKRNYEEVNINEILEDVISLYSLDENIKFEKELDNNLSLIIADKEEINRIFQNLIKNAIQSVVNNGKILCRTFNFKEKVIFEISDNGCGIEPDIIDKLFEPNFSTKSSGMGLGLAITKKSLDDMKATISIKSKINVGTIVKIEFNKA